jgi:hypothetical protein
MSISPGRIQGADRVVRSRWARVPRTDRPEFGGPDVLVLLATFVEMGAVKRMRVTLDRRWRGCC